MFANMKLNMLIKMLINILVNLHVNTLLSIGVNINKYTGKTTQYMHQRHGGHRSEDMNESSELEEHFTNCGVMNMMIQIIDCLKPGDDESWSILKCY